MPGLLIIAHAPLASSLKHVAAHTNERCAGLIEALDVAESMTPEQIEALGRSLLERVRDPDAIIFTDVYGATPFNVALRLAAQAEGGGVKVITGVNVPMLWRVMCYATEPLDALVVRALDGARDGVVQVSSTRPQNQTRPLAAHAQDPHQHQQ